MNAEVLIRQNEGCRLAVYDDFDGHVLAAGEIPKGTATVGIGHTGPDVVSGETWTLAEVEHVFQIDLARADSDAIEAVRPTQLDEVRLGALTDMAFQMGLPRLETFHVMLAALQTADWQTAQDACLMSKYAAQTPARAKRNAEMFLTGQWPDATASV